MAIAEGVVDLRGGNIFRHKIGLTQRPFAQLLCAYFYNSPEEFVLVNFFSPKKKKDVRMINF